MRKRLKRFIPQIGGGKVRVSHNGAAEYVRGVLGYGGGVGGELGPHPSPFNTGGSMCGALQW